MKYFFVILILLLFFFGCKKIADQTVSDVFEMPKPSYFPKVVYNNEKNVITPLGFALGKRLFNDPILSVDSSIACLTCHAPEHAFADHNVSLSKGVFGRLGIRNSPALFNLAWHTHFNWDGGVNHLEVFSIAPIENPNEMGESMKNILVKLNRNSYYRTRFKEVFNSDSVQDKELMYALTQYMLMLVSDNAKYDKVKRGEAVFTMAEQKGYEVFKTHCNSCHTEPLFMSNEFKSNGFARGDVELGREAITHQPLDKHKFKVPSLRNLQFTYPYMHNGRIWSLDEVLDHYEKAKPEALNADLVIVNGMAFTSEERKDLLAFLGTLNDSYFISKQLFR